MIRSLFSKILISHILVIVIITASIGLLLSHLVTNYLIEAKRAELIREGTAATEFITPSTTDRRNLTSLLENMSTLSGAQMWLTDKENNIISGQPPQRWHHRFNKRKHNRELLFNDDKVQSWVYRGRNDDDPSIVAAFPLPDNPSIALFLYTPITGISKTAMAIQELLFYSIVGSILLAGVFAFFLSRNLTKPISSISRAAEKFAGGDYTSRTSATGQDEIGCLGQTFNKMAQVLTQIEQNRREFFSDVTHELKTPIASIQALTESMLDGFITDETKRQRYLETILAETKHMNHLISELLNIAQLESGQLSFHVQTVELASFIQMQEKKYAFLLTEKNQQLIFTHSPELNTIETDATRLDQILANLISNAIRHSPIDGIIHVDITSQTARVIIAITDHGEGIPAKDLPYIWDRFYRVDKSRSRSKGGTGLGLAITKKLVEGMNGSISVNSIPGQETIFRITLPQN